jgi:hypothetical protein
MMVMIKLMDEMMDDNPDRCRVKNRRSTDEELMKDNGT